MSARLRSVGELLALGAEADRGWWWDLGLGGQLVESGYGMVFGKDRESRVEVRWISGGTFRMGSPAFEKGRETDEVQHEVVLTRGFWMAETACTQGLWHAVMGTRPSFFQGHDRPVERVGWEAAVSFCDRLTERHRQEGVLTPGSRWHLPTEAQWEYACRAGTVGPYYGPLQEVAWFRENSRNMTHPVRLRRANPWGLRDMIGNVWEWCADGYGPYATGTVIDPLGDLTSSQRVYRGGNWLFEAEDCRAAVRGRFGPNVHSNTLGFRVVLSPGL